MDNNSSPDLAVIKPFLTASMYILSPCSKTSFIVAEDHSDIKQCCMYVNKWSINCSAMDGTRNVCADEYQECCSSKNALIDTIESRNCWVKEEGIAKTKCCSSQDCAIPCGDKNRDCDKVEGTSNSSCCSSRARPCVSVEDNPSITFPCGTTANKGTAVGITKPVSKTCCNQQKTAIITTCPNHSLDNDSIAPSSQTCANQSVTHCLDDAELKSCCSEIEGTSNTSCPSKNNRNICENKCFPTVFPTVIEDIAENGHTNKEGSPKTERTKTSCCSSKTNENSCAGDDSCSTSLSWATSLESTAPGLDEQNSITCCSGKNPSTKSCCNAEKNNGTFTRDPYSSAQGDFSRDISDQKPTTYVCANEITSIDCCVDGDSCEKFPLKTNSRESVTHCVNVEQVKNLDQEDCNSTSSLMEEPISVVKVNVNGHLDELQMQTTKLRVQNICCPKESRIADEELRKLDGVESVRVNMIGRVVYVCHDPALVSPTQLMVALNKRHLGASIVDTGEVEDSENGLQKSLKLLLVFLTVQAVLFGITLGAVLSNISWYFWVAIIQICLGILPVLKKCFYAVRNREIDLNILITITVIGTLIIQEWIEGAAVVFVFTLANVLQQFCFYRVQKTISSLMLSKPSKAVIASTGECIPIEQVPIGSIIAVRQGELIPLDGVVIKGSASVDESSISGESVPVAKTLQSPTYSGTIIQHGYLELETTSSSTSSTMSKISSMVEEAQMNVSPTEIMVNKFAKFYTPLVVLLSALVFLIPLVLGLSGVGAYKGTIKKWGERALIVLVTACPCALLMATPIVVICGISGAARLGILIKGGSFLEALSQLKFLAFDKTGTLTEGKFQVVDILPVDNSEESTVLRWTAALESKSSHPLAAAVVTEYTGECIANFSEDAEELLPEVSDFYTMEGQGISGIVEGHRVQVGNDSLLKKLNIVLTQTFRTAYNTFCSESKTVVFVCVDGKLALMISLADIIRGESYTALRRLQHLGIHLSMLTGDSNQTASAVQSELKLDSFISEMKPDDKLNWIAEMKREEMIEKSRCFIKKRPHVVGMVGDGVNDGPALATADVGIAMAAAGSALAVEASGVALMTNNILKLPEMVFLSRFCRRLIFQNIIIAVLLKLVFVVIALTGFVRVWMAVLADLVGLAVVIVNGLRPLQWKPANIKAERSSEPKYPWRRKRPIFQYESVV